MEDITHKKIMAQLVSLGERQNAVALEASAYIQHLFSLAGITFLVEEYAVDLPQWGSCALTADGEAVACLPTGLTSGVITKNDPITTSLISSKEFLTTPHINVNERCRVISRANFSFAPSLAIAEKDIVKVTNATTIVGEVRVEKIKQKTEQILVGNLKNPKCIVFSHFDSVGTGAIDNASGTAMCIDLILKDPRLLDENLFVFDGNEEVSYDMPTYWGKGYRNFEEKYGASMETCECLVVVDCIGYEKTQVITEGDILPLAFPIQRAERYADKIRLVTSDYDSLMTVYHSDEDNGALVQDAFWDEAKQTLKRLID